MRYSHTWILKLRIRILKIIRKYIDELKYDKKLATFPMNPTYEEILKANSLRGNVIRKTPLIHSPTFSNLTNSRNLPKRRI